MEHQNLFGGLSPACDFVDLVQSGNYSVVTLPAQPGDYSVTAFPAHPRSTQSLRSCRLRIHPPNRFYYSSKSLPSGDSDSIGIETFFPRSSRAQFSVGRRQILPSAQTRFDSGRQPVRRGPSPCFHCDLVSVSAARSPRLLQRLTATTVRTLTLLAINNNSNKEAAEAFPRPSLAQSYPQRVHSCRFF